MRLEGLIIGVLAFAMIGLFHPLVIWCEYRFTDRIWPLFLVVGIAAVLGSCLVQQSIAAAALAIFGCSCLWSIRELKEQTQRVKKGWFPSNPNRPTPLEKKKP